jgi:hypothetical protein
VVSAFIGSWRRTLASALVAAGLMQLAWTAFASRGREVPLDPVCAAWDRQASFGIALLVPQTATLDETRLDDALYQLRRARKNCRVGWLEAARQDYMALQAAYPFPDRLDGSRERDRASR